MGKKVLIVLVLLFVSKILTAQTTDLARIEYLHLPFSKSDNSINRYRGLIQAPIPLDKDRKRLIVVGFEYRYVDVNIEDTEDVFAFGDNLVTSTQQIDVYLGYVWKHNENWRFGTKAGIKIQSDFEGKLISDDVIYEVGAYVINDRTKKPSRREKAIPVYCGPYLFYYAGKVVSVAHHQLFQGV
jgi:hypothetical protein